MNDQQFIDIWNAADSPSEVSTAIGTTKKSAIIRASRLRKFGHPVKRFASGPVAFREPYLPSLEEIEEKKKAIRASWGISS